MSELGKELRNMSPTTFELALARAFDVVLAASEDTNGTAILPEGSDNSDFVRLQQDLVPANLLAIQANYLDAEVTPAERLAAQYPHLGPEGVKGLAYGLDIAGLAIAYYVAAVDELPKQSSE